MNKKADAVSTALPLSLPSRLDIAFNGGPATVHSANIASATLNKSNPWWLHLYSAFLPIYVIYGCAYLCNRDSLKLSDEEFADAALIMLTLHALVFVLAHSSAVTRAGTTCTGVRSLTKADCICVVPVDPLVRSAALVPLVKPNADDPATWSFIYDYTTFLVTSVDPPEFAPVTYPRPSPALLEGRVVEAALQPARGDTARLHALCGANTQEIPIPPLAAICAENALLHYFLIPSACVGLWALLGYWRYALPALLVLVACECSEIYERITALRRLRDTRIKSSAVLALRDGEWTTVQSDRLYPGDVVSVTPSAGDNMIPADLLLLAGTVVANEAPLTRQQSPAMKQPIELRVPNERLDPDVSHCASVLFAGTKATQCLPAVGTPYAPLPPDGGALAVVLRTGFGTAHGAALRIQLRRTERRARYILYLMYALPLAYLAGRAAWHYGAGSAGKRAFQCVLAVVTVHAFFDAAVFCLALCLLPLVALSLASTHLARLYHQLGIPPAFLNSLLALAQFGTLPLLCAIPADAWGTAAGALAASVAAMLLMAAMRMELRQLEQVGTIGARVGA